MGPRLKHYSVPYPPNRPLASLLPPQTCKRDVKQVTAAAPLLVAILSVFPGCVGPASQPGAVGPMPPEPWAAMEGAVMVDGALRWAGKHLDGPEEWQVQLDGITDSGPCAMPACEARELSMRYMGDGTLRILVEGDRTDEDYTAPGTYLTDYSLHLRVTVRDSDGNDAASAVFVGHQGVAVEVDRPASSSYTIEVRAALGQGAYNASAHLVARSEAAAAAGPLLPDLAVASPDQLRFDAPLGRQAADALVTLGGCGPDEWVEQEARRCLRYATILENLGLGDFELRLPLGEAEAAAARTGGQWVQRVQHADGTVEDLPSAAAVYHPLHGHFHANGLQKAYIRAWDDGTGRGDVVAEGQKTGLCMTSGGIVDLGRNDTALPVPRDNDCCYYGPQCTLDIARLEDFVQGIAPGWYDTYPWWRADQFVEVTGLPDGIYEFVSVVDPANVVVESDEANNEASMLFQLAGDTVTELGPPPP